MTTKALPEEAVLRLMRDKYLAAPIDGDERRSIEQQMLEITDGTDEHPEWWDMPCLCDLCRSYA